MIFKLLAFGHVLKTLGLRSEVLFKFLSTEWICNFMIILEVDCTSNVVFKQMLVLRYARVGMPQQCYVYVMTCLCLFLSNKYCLIFQFIIDVTCVSHDFQT